MIRRLVSSNRLSGHTIFKAGLAFLILVVMFSLANPGLAADAERPAQGFDLASVPSLIGNDANGPRFVDNGDGTVTDNQTGLIWLKYVDCLGELSWAQARSAIWGLGHGHVCGNATNADDFTLADGSVPGDWRLPSIRELMTLPDSRYYKPALTDANGTAKWSEGDAFTGVVSMYYWSSTLVGPDQAWYMYLYNGVLGYSPLAQAYAVWPVRGRMRQIRWYTMP